MSIYRNFPGLDLDLWDTGGGCTALGKNLSFGGYVLLTAHDDASRPCENEPIAVGFYDEDGEHIDLDAKNIGGPFIVSAHTTDDEMAAFINKWATALEGR